MNSKLISLEVPPPSKASLLGGRFGRGPARPYSSGNFTIAVTAKVTKQKAMMLRKNC